MKNAKVIVAVEALLAALKECDQAPAAAAAPAKKGNRTVAVMDYDGKNPVQNVVDCLRRAMRISRESNKPLSKAERKVAAGAIKALKAQTRILNTNGRDILTINGA